MPSQTFLVIAESDKSSSVPYSRHAPDSFQTAESSIETSVPESSGFATPRDIFVAALRCDNHRTFFLKHVKPDAWSRARLIDFHGGEVVTLDIVNGIEIFSDGKKKRPLTIEKVSTRKLFWETMRKSELELGSN